ncbi:MAG TPA: hypothetical protein VNI01_04445, partial [Elusimicrobiota bacterium]|nr:hypothetical protein [Elusimicrobiota bacterium]
MTYARLFELLDVAQLSPERAAPALGVAGMTLRRWRALPPDASVPELYARAFEGAVAEMAASGEIAADHPLVADILVRRGGVSFQAAARALGFEGDGGAARGSERDLEGLARIGSDPVKAR